MSVGKTCLSFDDYLNFLKNTLANTEFTCPSINWEASIKSIINTEFSGVRVLHVKNTTTSKIDTYVDLRSSEVAGLIRNIGHNPFHLKVCCYGLTCLVPVENINFNDILTKTYRCGDTSVENDTDQLRNIINTDSSYWYKSLENNNLSLPSRINLADGQPLTALDDIFQNNLTDPTISGQYVGCTDDITCIKKEILGGTNKTWLYWLAEFNENAQILMSPLLADLEILDAFYQKCEKQTGACASAPDASHWKLDNLRDYLPQSLASYSAINSCLKYYKDPDAAPKNPGKIWSHMLTRECYNIYRSMRDTYDLKNFVITQGLITWFQGLRAQLDALLGTSSVIGTPDPCKRCGTNSECIDACVDANEGLATCVANCEGSSAYDICVGDCETNCKTQCGEDADCAKGCEAEDDECKDFWGCGGEMTYTWTEGGCSSNQYDTSDTSFSPNTYTCTIAQEVFSVSPDIDSNGIIVTKKSGYTSATGPSEDDCVPRVKTTATSVSNAWQLDDSCECTGGSDQTSTEENVTCCDADAYDPKSGNGDPDDPTPPNTDNITLETLATLNNCVVTSNPPLDDSSSYPDYKSITFSCKISN